MGQPHPTSECAHRGGTDEPAPVALEHAGQDRAETVVGTVEVDAEHLVPLRLSDLCERGLLSDTGVAEEDIDTAKRVLGAGNRLLDFLQASDINAESQGLTA